MAFYYIVEPIPLPVTSLMPLVLFPLLGVLTTTETTNVYFNNIGFVMFASLTMAVAVEITNLHKRIALKTFILLGASNRRLLMGFMLITMFLSMWIPNTASASIMAPIAMAVMDQIQGANNRRAEDLVLPMKVLDEIAFSFTFFRKEYNLRLDKMRKLVLLSVAYSANVGGTGTLVGTAPNLILKGLLDERFKDSDDLTFAMWMVYSVPPMLVIIIVAWTYVQYLLQKLTFEEGALLFLMAALIFLWFTLKPRAFPGWIEFFPYAKDIGSCVPATAVAILLFVVPKEPHKGSASPGILTWEDANTRIHWGVILLINGSMTLTQASKKSGMSAMLVKELQVLEALPDFFVVSILCFAASMFTELTSNAAASSIMLPLVLEMALALRVHPYYFALPVTAGCSFSFMLPAATPPNAIVYELGKFNIIDMVGPGFVMNMLCVTVELIAIHLLGFPLFDLGTFPKWAENQTLSTVKP
ncbi:solute carrier family 13 member 2-like [Ixodes scapularis]|uniref:solute carrier family 13 member 2-like n=1 Tax=Ixodes scapularis TaxID=6945 RepID=UPI001C38A776|nr:solute carrier family 13 member 2-like [Ixodes scapularis]